MRQLKDKHICKTVVYLTFIIHDHASFVFSFLLFNYTLKNDVKLIDCHVQINFPQLFLVHSNKTFPHLDIFHIFYKYLFIYFHFFPSN